MALRHVALLASCIISKYKLSCITCAAWPVMQHGLSCSIMNAVCCTLQGNDEARAQPGAAGGGPKRPCLRKPAADRKQLATGPSIEAGSELKHELASEQASAPAASGPLASTQSYTSPYSPTAGQAYSPSDAMGACSPMAVGQCQARMQLLQHLALHGSPR